MKMLWGVLVCVAIHSKAKKNIWARLLGNLGPVGIFFVRYLLAENYEGYSRCALRDSDWLAIYPG